MFGDEKMLEKKSIVKSQGKNKTKTYSEKKNAIFFRVWLRNSQEERKKKLIKLHGSCITLRERI